MARNRKGNNASIQLQWTPTYDDHSAEYLLALQLEDTPAAPGGDVFFQHFTADIEQGIKAQTAAGMGGVLVQ